MHSTQHAIQQVNQTRQIAQQLINQTQQGTQQYRMMLQQEQQNIQMLEQILNREKQTVQLLQQSLQNHNIAINRCEELINLCNQIQQWSTSNFNIETFGNQPVSRHPIYNQNQIFNQNQNQIHPQYINQTPVYR